MRLCLINIFLHIIAVIKDGKIVQTVIRPNWVVPGVSRCPGVRGHWRIYGDGGFIRGRTGGS